MSSDANSLSYQAGQAKAQGQENASSMLDSAKDSAQSAKDSLQEGGQMMREKTAGAAEAAKDATGMNKS